MGVGGSLSQAVGRTGRSSMGVENRSQMTSHCNGNHSKTSLSVCLFVCLAVFCHNPSYVTASRCARGFRLKELSD